MFLPTSNFRPKMKLRAKLFIPLALFCLCLAGYSHFIWLPKYTDAVLNEYQTNTKAHLKTAAEGLIPSLLEDRLANIYDNLDALLHQNEKWLSITLYSSDKTLLYPIDEPEPIELSDTVFRYNQAVRFDGPALGMLTLFVDVKEVIQHVKQLEHEFLLTLYSFLVVVIISIGTIVEFVVRRPIQALAYASSRLSMGDYHSNIPGQTQDEIGDLIHSFENMRDSIKAYQEKLKGEIDNHKQTTDELIKQKEKASYQASHDALTGLINRREFEKRVNNALDLSRSDGSSHVLLYIDLDQFKIVNDTCGHVAGDMLLRQLSSLLQERVRQHDTLARLGGDEFGILFEYCNMGAAIKIAELLLDTAREFRFKWENKLFSIGASIGAIEFTAQTGDYFYILSAADSACYSAKDQGRNRIQVFKPEDKELNRRKGEMLWVTRLIQGLQENRFVLYCQPVHRISNGESRPAQHYEVLLRLKENNGTIVTPNKFIQSAERYNIISKIDLWVVVNTLKLLNEYYSNPNRTDAIRLSINLSGVSLGDANILKKIEQLFNRYKPPMGSIGIEITETAAIQKLPQALRFMREMKLHGCQFYLDDFGSGLSSYSYLKSIPADYIKIDGTFIRDIDKDPVDYAMVKSINDICHVMGKKTIAEFVETESIVEKLVSLGIDYAQGYHFMQPFPLVELLFADELMAMDEREVSLAD
ncbi:MAG: EAL domain-containing protein [Gammaproteobacteria bacterium]|nr:EAL domain-containing protein [Gammaproteobacteria bacterium]